MPLGDWLLRVLKPRFCLNLERVKTGSFRKIHREKTRKALAFLGVQQASNP